MSDHTELEERLRTAVHAHTAGVQAEDASLDAIRTRVRVAKRRRRAVLAGAGIAAALAVAVAVPRLGDEGRVETFNQPGPTTSVAPPTTTAPGSSTTVAPPPPQASDSAEGPPASSNGDAAEGPPASSNGDAGAEFQYPPLWPFSTQAEVDAWRQQHAAQGTQPWHLDAEATALAFTTGFLGFGEIDQVVASDVRDREAWVSVGYDTGSGSRSTAAVVHLVRFGPGDGAPWEVVGTRDTDLTLETPSYGSSVSSPVRVGGRITGVDENLRVQVRQPSSQVPIGEACCLPAGGQGTPWQTTVSFSGATDPALTIVVSTGGHFQGVERFAITGVRP